MVTKTYQYDELRAAEKEEGTFTSVTEVEVTHEKWEQKERDWTGGAHVQERRHQAAS
jgi:hypothetical protein